ncbi:glutamate racemase [Sulfurovum sp. bin170]|uniref:glutamate racemase n=1 Tax=Sulfurovum sp. bin170 TaxID=2695268 RepID=UPI0013DEA2E4|nr:glutamate racemase [Sulfurovum sp. bin170]NEW60571.1 glutamate racemase [Sulfurovum sp. bin170]
MKIGVFDSGAGGLSVVKSLLEHKLFDEIIYYGDTARVPYGTKDQNTIIRYSLEALEFFNNFDIDLLITACNTVSAYALSDMNTQSRYPVYGVIESGVMAVEKQKIKKDDEILIIATRATIGSKSYQEALGNLGYSSITAIQTGLFVPMVEEGIFGGEILHATMKHYFSDVPEPKAIILGCTHFPLIGDTLQSYFKQKPLLIHSGEAIVEYLEARYDLSTRDKESKLKIFASDNVIGLRKIADNWLGRAIK